MNQNFDIAQGMELVLEGRRFDLHNRFAFEAIKVMPDRVALVFSPDPIWGPDEPQVTIVFDGVAHLSFSKGFGTLPNLTDLHELGYKAPDDHGEDYLNAAPSSREDHLVFWFGGNQSLRIWSEFATAHARTDPLRLVT